AGRAFLYPVVAVLARLLRGESPPAHGAPRLPSRLGRPLRRARPRFGGAPL
ncbi:MAG: hypothetical protein AVDCRST_MAG08-1098, partial [uncultured Acetobacteraceae bacterium]